MVEKTEETKVAQILGWCLVAGKEKEYCLQFPKLSVEESLLVSETLQEYSASPEKKNEKSLKAILETVCEKKELILGKEQKQYLVYVLENSAHRFGPLSELLEDNNLEEISGIGLGLNNSVRVFHFRNGWMKTNLCLVNEEWVKECINKMARPVGRRLSFKTPKINAVLGNGFRLNASMKPVAFSGINFTIRRFRNQSLAALDLVKLKVLNMRMLSFLKLAIECEASILVAGNTGSGKTSTLNALFEFMPEEERLILLEETPELSIHKAHIIRLMVEEEQGIELNELISETLRMRPDRIIVGELRTAKDVQAFLNTLQAGQGKGSYATFHAVNAAEAVKRMNNLGAEKYDIASLDLLLIQRRWSHSKENHQPIRKITEIAELDEDGNVRILFEFDFEKNEWIEQEKSQRIAKKVGQCLGCSEKEFAQIWKNEEEQLWKNWKN
ncbi:MAG: ATPase, T2SS/T4P/T4SS family [Candidatus Diapherotrites archaeon]|nr:ATPase, T2SS/T4P/T4SS family [Candidatus Diapherotrites archaeon]